MLLENHPVSNVSHFQTTSHSKTMNNTRTAKKYIDLKIFKVKRIEKGGLHFLKDEKC